MKNKEIFKIARARLNRCRCNSKVHGWHQPTFTWEELSLVMLITDTCPICERKLPLKKLFVDHDHSTGALRGLLCLTCNMQLGHHGDSLDGFRKFAARVEKYYGVDR